MYTVGFELKPDAGQNLFKECGKSDKRMLAVLIDGQYYGSWWFIKRDSEKFAASAGSLSSEAEP